jgi:hypothetical protein
MKAPHLRLDRIPNGGEVPSGQARALDRRRELEARQRAFRDLPTERPATSAADLTPVRRRPRSG